MSSAICFTDSPTPAPSFLLLSCRSLLPCDTKYKVFEPGEYAGQTDGLNFNLVETATGSAFISQLNCISMIQQTRTNFPSAKLNT